MKLLVIRFSAMGDVALTVPVINRVLVENPELEITFLSQIQYKPFFYEIPRFTFWPKKPQAKFEIWSLIQLSWDLAQRESFNGIIDLHGSLRARIISFFYSVFTGFKVQVNRIDKGREEKKSAIRRENKSNLVLVSTVNRYLNVFRNSALLNKTLDFSDEGSDALNSEWPGIRVSKPLIHAFRNRFGEDEKPLIGWAPFAGFSLKELPFNQQEKCLRKIILEIPQAKIILFSSSSQRNDLLAWLNDPLLKTHLYFSGDLCSTLEEELALMTVLDLMVSMDSSNMHLAALVATKVVGLYGTTHPNLGFFPFLQRNSGTFGIDLFCRPCSIYGNTHCYRGDFSCMQNLSEELILNRIKQRLS